MSVSENECRDLRDLCIMPESFCFCFLFLSKANKNKTRPGNVRYLNNKYGIGPRFTFRVIIIPNELENDYFHIVILRVYKLLYI